MDGSMLCRICIATDTDVIMISIFGEDGLYQKIKSFANVDIEEGDSLPQQICMMCARNVLNACSFKRKCEESDRIYRNQLLHKPSTLKVQTSNSNENMNKMPEPKLQSNKEIIDLDESDSDEDDDDDDNDDEDDDDDDDDDDDVDDGSRDPTNNKFTQEVKFTDEIDKIDLSNPKYNGNNDDDDDDDENMEELRNEWNSQSQNTTDDDQLPLIPEIELITPNEEVKVADSHIQGYQCSICFQIFNMRATLNHHIKTFHPESSPSFECFNCRKQYLSKRFLEKHIRRGRCVRKRKNTTRPMRCSGCNVIFPTGHHLGWHKRTGCPSKISEHEQKKLNVHHMNTLLYRENVLKKMYNFNKFRKPKQKGRSRIKLDAYTITYAKQLIAQDATTSKMAQELNISRTFAWRLRKSLLSASNLNPQNGNLSLNEIENPTVPSNALGSLEAMKPIKLDESQLKKQQQQNIENDTYLERIANNNSLEMTMITNPQTTPTSVTTALLPPTSVSVAAMAVAATSTATTKQLAEKNQNNQLTDEQIQLLKDNQLNSIQHNNEIRFIPIMSTESTKSDQEQDENSMTGNKTQINEIDSQQQIMPKISVVSEKILKGQNDIDSLQKRIESLTNQPGSNEPEEIEDSDDDDDEDDDDDDSDDVQIDENFHGPQPGGSAANAENMKMLYKMIESKIFDPKLLDPKHFNKMMAKLASTGDSMTDIIDDSQIFDPKIALQQSLVQFPSTRNSKKPRKQNVFLDEEKYEKAKILVANHATTLEIARALDVSQMSAWKLRDSILKGIPLQFRKSSNQQQYTHRLSLQQQIQQFSEQQKQLQQQQHQQLQKSPNEIQIKTEDSNHTTSSILPATVTTTTPSASTSPSSSTAAASVAVTAATTATASTIVGGTGTTAPTTAMNQLLHNGIKMGGRGRVKASVKIERDKQITEIILDYIRADPSIQYWKITEKLAEKGFIISTSSICQKLKALGFHRRSKGANNATSSTMTSSLATAMLNNTSNKQLLQQPQDTSDLLKQNLITSDDNSGSDLFGAHFLSSTFSD